MQHYAHNPRKITDTQLARLGDTLARLGDLGGIVVNVETQEIVGGNQRVKSMNLYGATPTITETFDPPTPQGTVAVGYVEHPTTHERFAYRAVRWTREQCDEANLVANAAGGSFDWAILNEHFDANLLASAGLDADALAAMNDGANHLREMIQGDEANDPNAEWQGMPEFHQEDKTAYKSIIVHFDSQDNVNNFAELVEQTITDKTKFIWYPKAKIDRYADKTYAAES